MTPSHPYRRSTDKGLTWGKAKDVFLVASIGAVPTLLGLLYSEQTKMNKTLTDLEKSIAVVAEQSKEHRCKIKDLQARLLVVERER